METDHSLKIGLYGIGLDTYWDQFEGLKDKLNGYQDSIENMLLAEHHDIHIVNTGIVDNPASAREVGHKLKTAGVDIILLYVSTYAL